MIKLCLGDGKKRKKSCVYVRNRLMRLFFIFFCCCCPFLFPFHLFLLSKSLRWFVRWLASCTAARSYQYMNLVRNSRIPFTFALSRYINSWYIEAICDSNGSRNIRSSTRKTAYCQMGRHFISFIFRLSVSRSTWTLSFKLIMQ